MRKFFVLVFLASMTQPASAGIPVIDPTAIASAIQNAIQSYNQALKEFELLRQQYSQLQKLETMSTGTRGFNKLTNNPANMSNIAPDLNTALANIRNSATFAQERAKYPVSKDARENTLFDQVAMQNATIRDYSARSAARVQEMQAQKAQYDQATDPAGRAEAANAIAANKAIIEADNAALAALKEQLTQQANEAFFALERKRNCQHYAVPSQAAACQ